MQASSIGKVFGPKSWVKPLRSGINTILEITGIVSVLENEVMD